MVVSRFHLSTEVRVPLYCTTTYLCPWGTILKMVLGFVTGQFHWFPPPPPPPPRPIRPFKTYDLIWRRLSLGPGVLILVVDANSFCRAFTAPRRCNCRSILPVLFILSSIVLAMIVAISWRICKYKEAVLMTAWSERLKTEWVKQPPPNIHRSGKIVARADESLFESRVWVLRISDPTKKDDKTA